MSESTTRGDTSAKRTPREGARERALRSDAKASRKALLAAARELFAEGGHDALTVVEVAKRAGLNRSTAYQHFRSRQEITRAVAAAFAREVGEMFRQPRDFRAQIDFFVHYFHEHPDIARLWMFHLLSQQSREGQGWDDYIESLDRLAKSPRSQTGIDAEMLGVIGMTSALVWSVMARQRSGSEEAAQADTDRFAAELKRLLIRGTLLPEYWPEAIQGMPMDESDTSGRTRERSDT
jgi:AcrR family transcriptional regulator